MTNEELSELFDRHDPEYLRFERVRNPRSRRQDVHAFLLLDELAPPEENEHGLCQDMICCADNEQIILGTDVDKLAKVITEEHVLELVRCGVFLGEGNRLKMIV